MSVGENFRNQEALMQNWYTVLNNNSNRTYIYFQNVGANLKLKLFFIKYAKTHLYQHQIYKNHLPPPKKQTNFK